MKRSTKLALSLILAAGTVAPAFAQDQFPDVPANHWAYEALLRMKRDGLLVGYPDGLFRGPRPASRYELAVAMHAVYTNLKNVTDGLDAQVRALQDLVKNGNPEIQALKDSIAQLQSELAAMRGYGDDIAALKRAADTFEKELTQLGVDVQAMKDDLRDLGARVTALEAKKPAIEFGGSLDLWLGGGHSDGDRYGLSRDGRLTGIRNKGVPSDLFGAPERAGITDDLSILHELAVDFASTNETGVRFKGTLVLGNAFGQNPVAGVVSGPIGFGNQSDVFNPTAGNAGSPFLVGYGEGTGDLYLQDLTFSYAGRRVDVDFGRVAHQATPWIFRRIDNTLYFDNARWDDGNYRFDGAVARTHVGPVKLEAYGGTKNNQSVNGVQIDPLRSGLVGGLFGEASRLTADRLLGGTLSANVGSLNLRGDYLVVDTAGEPVTVGTGAQFDHLDVYGGEGHINLGRFRVSGGLRQSKAYANDVHIENLTDTAWDAKVAWASGNFDLWAQYRQVGLNYLAPGDWGRLGILRNPTNIRGFLGEARVKLSRRFALNLQGETSRGLDNGDAALGTLLDRDTKINRYGVRLDAGFGRGWSGVVYYENTSFSDVAFGDGAIGGSPRYQWYGLGVAHQLSANASFSLRYEQSAIRNDYQTTPLGGSDFRGGFLTSQVTVKF